MVFLKAVQRDLEVLKAETQMFHHEQEHTIMCETTDLSIRITETPLSRNRLITKEMNEVIARGQMLTEQPTSTQLKDERKRQRLLILRHFIMTGQDTDILKLKIIDTTTERITMRDQKNLSPDPRQVAYEIM